MSKKNSNGSVNGAKKLKAGPIYQMQYTLVAQVKNEDGECVVNDGVQGTIMEADFGKATIKDIIAQANDQLAQKYPGG